MRYKDFEGTLEDLVEQKLQEIEEKEHVRILHAVESGSRSWDSLPRTAIMTCGLSMCADRKIT